MAIYSLADLRASAPEELRGASDEVLLNEYSKATGLNPLEVADYLGHGKSGGTFANRVTGALANYTAGMRGLGEAITGSEGLRRRREGDELEAAIAANRVRELGGVNRWADVNSLSDFGSYAADLAIQSAPYLVETAAGGLVGRGLATGARLALRTAGEAGDLAGVARAQRTLTGASLAGAGVASYPSAVGDILQSQRDQSPTGETNLGMAALGGVPYAAANMVGLEGAAARLGGFRSAGRFLDDMGGVRGGAARAAATGARVGLTEGGAETFQEGVNQYFGRMAVDPNETFYNPKSAERFKESFIGGATLGGLGGAGLGGWRRSQSWQAEQLRQQFEAQQRQKAITETGPFDLLRDSAPVDTDTEVGGLMSVVNPYNLGGYVDQLRGGGETDVTQPQIGLFGGGGETTMGSATAPAMTSEQKQTVVQQEKAAKKGRIARAKEVTGVASTRAAGIVEALDNLVERGRATFEERDALFNSIAQAKNKAEAYKAVEQFIAQRSQPVAAPAPAAPQPQVLVANAPEAPPNQLLTEGQPNVGVPDVPRPDVGGSGAAGGVVAGGGVDVAGRVPAPTVGVPGTADGVLPAGTAPATAGTQQPAGPAPAVAPAPTPAKTAKTAPVEKRIEAKVVAAAMEGKPVLSNGVLDLARLKEIVESEDPLMYRAVMYTLGRDTDGDKTGSALSAEAAAAKIGKPGSGATVRRIWKALGLDDATRKRIAASEVTAREWNEEPTRPAAPAQARPAATQTEGATGTLANNELYKKAVAQNFNNLSDKEWLELAKALLRTTQKGTTEDAPALKKLNNVFTQRAKVPAVRKAMVQAIELENKARQKDEPESDAFEAEYIDDTDAVERGEVRGADEDVQPSISGNRRKGPVHTAESLEDALTAFMRTDVLGRRVIIVETAGDLQTMLSRGQISELIGLELAGQKPVAFASDGTAYLIADRIAVGREKGIFLHEVGGHLGLQDLLDAAQFNRLARRIYEWAKLDDGSVESEIAKLALARVKAAKTAPDQRRGELLAYFIEEAVNAGIDPTTPKQNSELGRWLRSIWGKMVSMLRSYGVVAADLTAQDLVDFAYGAAQVAMRAPENRYSQSIQPSIAAPANMSERPLGQTTKILQSVPAPLRASSRGIMANLRRFGRKSLNYWTFTTDLLKRANDLGLTSAKGYLDLHNLKASFVGQHEQRVSTFMARYAQLPDEVKGRQGAVNTLLRDSTREGKWAFQPTWLDEQVEVDAAMADRFNALPEPAQQFVRDVFEFGNYTLEQKKATIRETVNAEYDALIKSAEDANDKKKVAEYKADRDAALKQFGSLMRLSGKTPYAPLKRFGNLVVVAKSDAYLAAEAAEDAAEIKKLQRDEDHYFVDFVETAGQAEALSDRLRATGKYSNDPDAGVVYRERESLRNELYSGSSTIQALEKLRGQIDAMYDRRSTDPGEQEINDQQRLSAAKLHNMVTELYILTLAEDSARRSELRRKGVAGDIDMIRSLETQGRSDANFLGGAKYNYAMLEKINAMRRELRKGGQQLEKSEIFNEILARHVQGSDYSPSPTIDKINRLTSVWFLATSPAYYIQNATQPWLMSMPIMAGKKGRSLGAVGSALTKAYGDIAKPFGEAGLRNFDFDKLLGPDNKTLSDGEKNMLRELLNKQQLDIGMATELGQFRIEGRGQFGDGVNKIDDFLRNTMQKMEAVNRITTALAAYRLEKAEGSSDTKALEYTSQIINDTHGDYSAWNAPRAFNTKLGKVALQFRKFQLIQLSLLAKLAKASFGSAPPSEKAAARQALAFMLTQAFLVGGARALPIPAAVGWALSAAFGEAGEPPEYLVRQYLGDNPFTDMIIGGIPATFGINTQQVGMGNTFAVLPFTDINLTDRAGLAQTAFALFGGPVGGLGYKFSDGVGLMMNGDYYKGFEQILPRGVGSIMKSGRLATEGVTQRDGDVTVNPENFNAWQLAQQAIGITPEVEVRRMFNQRTAFEVQKNLDGREQRIKKDYREAIRNRDNEAAADARRAWMDYNETRRNLGFQPKPIKTLLEAPKAQGKRESEMIGGVQSNAQNRGFVQRLTGQ